MKLHTTLKLRTTIEISEELNEPSTLTTEQWDNVSRVQKWTMIFSNTNNVEYEDFIQCTRSLSDNPEVLAKLVKEMYGILNARVHNYVNHKKIDSTVFREDKMRRLAECFDGIDI